MTEFAGSWASRGNCVAGNNSPDQMFVSGAEQNIAKRICRGCVVIHECLADALDNRIEYGVWGGRTERERRAMLRRYPEVKSWRSLFEIAMRQQGTIPGASETSQQPNATPVLDDSAPDVVMPPLPEEDTGQTA